MRGGKRVRKAEEVARSWVNNGAPGKRRVSWRRTTWEEIETLERAKTMAAAMEAAESAAGWRKTPWVAAWACAGV